MTPNEIRLEFALRKTINIKEGEISTLYRRLADSATLHADIMSLPGCNTVPLFNWDIAQRLNTLVIELRELRFFLTMAMKGELESENLSGAASIMTDQKDG